jgi:hypothetical protein
VFAGGILDGDGNRSGDVGELKDGGRGRGDGDEKECSETRDAQPAMVSALPFISASRRCWSATIGAVLPGCQLSEIFTLRSETPRQRAWATLHVELATGARGRRRRRRASSTTFKEAAERRLETHSQLRQIRRSTSAEYAIPSLRRQAGYGRHARKRPPGGRGDPQQRKESQPRAKTY